MYVKITDIIEKEYKHYYHFVFSDSNLIPNYINEENKKIIINSNAYQEFIKKIENKEDALFDFGVIQDGNSILTSIILLGDKDKFDLKLFRLKLYKTLKDVKGQVLISFSDSTLEKYGIIAEVVEHINYKFDKYITNSKKEDLKVDLLSKAPIPEFSEELELAKISNIVKDLINEQAEVMTPKFLAETVKNLAKEFNFDVKIIEEDEAKELGMEAFLSVGRAAHHRPCVIVMSHMGDNHSNYKFGLVGKGLTYDTGGLSLKPSDSMMNMKEDMSGAATMIGTMCAISKMNIKKNVIGVIAACENSIGPNAYRPSDIVTTMNGKTIEINNTDAEGRVTLADALTYIIRQEKVDEVIDAATLTGAILIALGEDLTGLFTNDDSFSKEFIKASEYWMEEFWQMPMNNSFKRYLKSDVADMQNSGGRMGASISAAKFLEEFVENKKWIHLDIAGTAFCNGNNDYYKKGATGQVFRTIYTYIKNSK